MATPDLVGRERVLARRRGGPQERLETRRDDPRLVLSPFGHVARDLAADRGDVALEIAEARLARVARTISALSALSENSILEALSPFSSICFGTRWRVAMTSFSSSV